MAKRRRGAETFELIVAFPVLFIATLATFQFGILLLVQQAITTAAVEGSREAAEGGDIAAVNAIVESVLGVHNLQSTPTGNVRVVLETPGNPLQQAGNAAIDCTPTGPPLAAGEVRVTVCVRVTDPAGTDAPVPNWLKNFGLDFAGRTFEISSLALAE